jgi:hypothetical protein
VVGLLPLQVIPCGFGEKSVVLSSRAIALKRRREQQCRAVVVRHEPQHLHVIKLAFNMKVSWLFLFVWLFSYRSSATTVPSKRTEGCVLRSEEGARVLSGQQTVEQKQRLRGPKALSAPR